MFASDLPAVGIWRSGPVPPGFDGDAVLAAVRDFRRPVHVVREGARGRLGVAMAGDVLPADQQNGVPTWPLVATLPGVWPEWLGDRTFVEVHRTRFPYVAGAMANGIHTAKLTIALARAGMLGFFGAAGLPRVAAAGSEEEAADGRLDSQRFRDAVSQGDLALVRSFLERDPALASLRDERGRSALVLAFLAGHPEMAEALRPLLPALDLVEAVLVADGERVRELVAKFPRLLEEDHPVGGRPVHAAAEDLIQVNEVAAMPSLHTALTVLFVLAVGIALPRTRRWSWLYPLAMGVALVYLGEHYLVDVLAGGAVAFVAWRLARSAWGPFAVRESVPRADLVEKLRPAGLISPDSRARP